jgi:AhpD family alkylhydroperoxidase
VSRKRTHTPRSWPVDAIRLILAGPRLLAIYGRGRVDPALRERVMVAVARANACQGCTRVHEAWALRAGVSAEELELIGAGELAPLRAEERAAIVYATALAEAGLGHVSADAQAVADDHLDSERRRDIEAVARLMTFANLSVNTADAVLRRLRRGHAPDGAPLLLHSLAHSRTKR